MIEFKNIQIKYGDFTAIDNLNLTIDKGEFFTFLGPSGCGKTTTLRSLVGFATPTAGDILLEGNRINDVPIEKRGIGIVFQSYTLFPTMTVYDNIAFGLKVQKCSKDEVHERVKEVSEKIELSETQLARNVSELSGGQQQRVALARAIILRPSVLCLDEPLSNLDAKLRVGLRGELKRLQRNLGITTLYVTHDQEEALTLSDRIAVFSKGVIEQVGTPYEIYNHSATEFVCDFIGDINRIHPALLVDINRQLKQKASDKRFDESKEAYIRIERVNTSGIRDNCDIHLMGKVCDSEYNGIYTKYTYAVLGNNLKSIEKNDGSVMLSQGDETALRLSSRDIMQF